MCAKIKSIKFCAFLIKEYKFILSVDYDRKVMQQNFSLYRTTILYAFLSNFSSSPCVSANKIISSDSCKCLTNSNTYRNIYVSFYLFYISQFIFKSIISCNYVNSTKITTSVRPMAVARILYWKEGP